MTERETDRIRVDCWVQQDKLQTFMVILCSDISLFHTSVFTKVSFNTSGNYYKCVLSSILPSPECCEDPESGSAFCGVPHTCQGWFTSWEEGGGKIVGLRLVYRSVRDTAISAGQVKVMKNQGLRAAGEASVNVQIYQS